MPARVKSSSALAVASVDKNGLDSGDYDDDTDKIVREIDVFLSPELASQLYLLQYPLEHGTAYVAPTEARMKPQHGILQLTEPFPQNTELQGDYRHLDKRIYESQTIPVTTHLCVGKLKANENGETAMHLVPLNHIAQMRPSFAHLATDEDNLDEPMYDSDDDADDKQKPNKPIIFQRKETERAANTRRSSYAFMKASEDSEPWVDLEVCVEGSIEHHGVMDKVYCTVPEHNVIQHEGICETAYVQSLNYLPKDAIEAATLTATAPAAPAAVADQTTQTSTTNLATIVTQLTTLMLSGCPIPFSILRNQVSAQVSNQDLFTALAACAILVKGNFCIQSKLLSLPKPMQRARTFILLLLHQESIERARLDRAFSGKVSSERLLSLLQQTARLTADSGWTLKVEGDSSFEARYPDQVQVYQQLMERLQQKYHVEMKRYRS